MINIDAAEVNMVVVYSKVEELRADCERLWEKVACPLEQLIHENNLTVKGLKMRDAQLAKQEDVMDGRVSSNCIKIEALQAQVGTVTP
ncbi:MAG TPA: hypothetical protein VHV10_17995 [Ktedonobacteraceae bacterium]|nr:hypothetical protein [Ktedonobacteraceae bacterium]